MKFVFITFFLLTSAIIAFPQNSKKCSFCKNNKIEIQNKHFNKYYGKISVLKQNCSEYFGVDLEKEINEDSLASYIFDFKFDALGCVYPEILSEKPEDFRSYFEKRRKGKRIKTKAYLFRNTFLKFKEDEKFIELFNKIQNDSLAVKLLSHNEQIGITTPLKSIPTDSMLKFKNEWDEVFLKKRIALLNKKIKEQDINKLVFLVHGYNVPYSIAKLQSNTFINEVKNKDEKTLYVNIYWPSTNRKIIIDAVNLKTFWLKDKPSPYSISGFSSIVTRTFIIGNSLNQILNEVTKEFKGEINLFGHSLGCAIISAAILPQTSKVTDKESKIYEMIKKQTFKVDSSVKVKVFLNAPALAGLETFRIESFCSNSKNVKWVIGYNPTDKVLNKTISIFRFGDNNGNTRLGGNWENEAWKLKDELKKNKLDQNFDFVRTSMYKDIKGHDFFCYFNHELFQKHLKEFLVSKID